MCTGLKVGMLREHGIPREVTENYTVFMQFEECSVKEILKLLANLLHLSFKICLQCRDFYRFLMILQKVVEKGQE